MENENNKCLYKCESIIDVNEYKKMARYFPKRMYLTYVKRSAFLNLILTAIIAIATQSLLFTLEFFVVSQIIYMIVINFRLEYYAEQGFYALEKQGPVDKKIETEFYEDYLIRKGETISFTVKYSDISKCIETDTNFYLEYGIKNVIIIFQKASCSEEIMEFIRKTFFVFN